MTLTSSGHTRGTSERGRQAVIHPAEPRGHSVLINIKFNRRHWDAVWGWISGDKRKQRDTAQAHRLWHSSGFGPPRTQRCQATLNCLGSKYEETVGHQVSEESWQQETKTNGKVIYKQEMTREAAKTFKKSN